MGKVSDSQTMVLSVVEETSWFDGSYLSLERPQLVSLAFPQDCTALVPATLLFQRNG